MQHVLEGAYWLTQPCRVHVSAANAHSLCGPLRETSRIVRHMLAHIEQSPPSRSDRTKQNIRSSSSIMVDQKLNWGRVWER